MLFSGGHQILSGADVNRGAQCADLWHGAGAKGDLNDLVMRHCIWFVLIYRTNILPPFFKIRHWESKILFLARSKKRWHVISIYLRLCCF
jgi:hypothetical protein